MVSSTPRPHFNPGKYPIPILHEAGWVPEPVWTGGKSRPHRDSIPDRPARSQSLYRLSNPAHNEAISKGPNNIQMLIFYQTGTEAALVSWRCGAVCLASYFAAAGPYLCLVRKCTIWMLVWFCFLVLVNCGKLLIIRERLSSDLQLTTSYWHRPTYSSLGAFA